MKYQHLLHYRTHAHGLYEHRLLSFSPDNQSNIPYAPTEKPPVTQDIGSRLKELKGDEVTQFRMLQQAAMKRLKDGEITAADLKETARDMYMAIARWAEKNKQNIDLRALRSQMPTTEEEMLELLRSSELIGAETYAAALWNIGEATDERIRVEKEDQNKNPTAVRSRMAAISTSTRDLQRQLNALPRNSQDRSRIHCQIQALNQELYRLSVQRRRLEPTKPNRTEPVRDARGRTAAEVREEMIKNNANFGRTRLDPTPEELHARTTHIELLRNDPLYAYHNKFGRNSAASIERRKADLSRSPTPHVIGTQTRATERGRNMDSAIQTISPSTPQSEEISILDRVVTAAGFSSRKQLDSSRDLQKHEGECDGYYFDTAGNQVLIWSNNMVRVIDTQGKVLYERKVWTSSDLMEKHPKKTKIVRNRDSNPIK